MELRVVPTTDEDGETLAALRVAAMRESLEALGRFEPERARTRFLNSFDPRSTFRVLSDSVLIGFYVLRDRDDYLWLDHLYVAVEQHGLGAGSQIIEIVKNIARERKKPLRLGALKESRANAFYLRHDFIEQERKEWDIYYEWAPD
ncbi:GNAT family N-acetyltransferase [Pelagibius sp. Alg239-R121]|uniref:GNAT family N-acetyltransferase n=1 Tax=Pelagibius sp. Alg239-R121 TaxID=2993448 RepID=UPI0024A6F334|nr:GNAT family N-acetyltransferase [Pelagibius sp. Alg239-R121]